MKKSNVAWQIGTRQPPCLVRLFYQLGGGMDRG